MRRNCNEAQSQKGEGIDNPRTMEEMAQELTVLKERVKRLEAWHETLSDEYIPKIA